MSVKQEQVNATNEHLKTEKSVVEAIANLKSKKVEWVEIEYGDTDEGDFVFHFSDWHAQRTFPIGKKAEHLIWNIIAKELDNVIPAKKIEAIGSPEGWDKALYTIKVKEFNSGDWNFEDDRIEKAIEIAAEKVSKIIEQTTVRKRF